MAEKTRISWTHHTFNPIWGCRKVSAGCANCYAAEFAASVNRDCWGDAPRIITAERNWRQVLRWNREAFAAKEHRRVFCASMCDVFEDHPTHEQMRPRLWQLITDTPWLQWLLLTKRPENIERFLPFDWGQANIWGSDFYPNVWLGTSIENEKVARRAQILRQIPCAVRFISHEPALGVLRASTIRDFDWLIYGGESGPGYRRDQVQWRRTMRDRCAAENVAFYYKQPAAPRQAASPPELDGRTWQEYPTPRPASV